MQNTTKKLILVTVSHTLLNTQYTFKIQLIHYIKKDAVHSSFWCKQQLQEPRMLEEVGTTHTDP